MNDGLKLALATLRTGGVIAHPAEGVWGLACDYRAQAAAERIRAIKARPPMPYILLCASFEQLAELLPEAQAYRQLIDASYPRARSWRLRRGWEAVPDWVRAGEHSVVVRCSTQPLLIELIEALGAPIISTSANSHGQPAPRIESEIEARVREQVNYVLSGETLGQAGASEIYDVDSLKRLR